MVKKENYVKELEKLLLRSQLDRPQMLNEKFYCIWRDAPTVDKQQEREDRLRSTARLLGKSEKEIPIRISASQTAISKSGFNTAKHTNR